VTNPHVITQLQTSDADQQVQVADLRVILNLTDPSVDDGKPDADSFANAIAEKQPVSRAFQKRRQHRDGREH
jgi:hypothetical protein